MLGTGHRTACKGTADPQRQPTVQPSGTGDPSPPRFKGLAMSVVILPYVILVGGILLFIAPGWFVKDRDHHR